MASNMRTIHIEEPQIDEHANQIDHTQRAQWLRAAVLGANDGLISTSSLIMGVGSATTSKTKHLIITGIAAMVAGACSISTGEYVSLQTQVDSERARMKRDHKAAVASAISFIVGAIVPILGVALITNPKARLGVLVAVTSVGFFIFGALGDFLGKSPLLRPSFRVLIRGWLAMAVTIGVTKLVEISGI